MHLHPINGAAHRVGANETAFGHRDKNFAPVIVGIWSDPADNEVNIKWVKDYYAAIHPHSGSDGATSTSCPATTTTERLQTMAPTTRGSQQ